jgi:tetratricopeptide (TPR) repeat protein
MRAKGLWVVLFLSAGLGGAARAETSEQEVERLSNEAVDAYKGARFQKAVELLTRAYAIRPLTPLLYNLAKAYDKLGDGDNAYANYKKYVDSGEADAKLEEKARARIAFYEPQMKKKQEEEEARKKAVEKPEKPPGPTAEEIAAQEEQKRQKARTLDLIGGAALAVVGLAGIGTGVGLYAGVSGQHDQFAGSTDETMKRQLAQSASTLGLVSTIAYAVGGLAVVASLWFFYSALFRHKAPPAEQKENEKGEEKPEEKPAETLHLIPWVSPQGAGAGASWSF